MHQPTRPRRCRTGARRTCSYSGSKIFGLLARRILIPSTSSSEALLRGIPIGPNTKEFLTNSIIEVFANFPMETVVNPCSRVRPRLEEVVAANGDFIR